VAERPSLQRFPIAPSYLKSQYLHTSHPKAALPSPQEAEEEKEKKKKTRRKGGGGGGGGGGAREGGMRNEWGE